MPIRRNASLAVLLVLNSAPSGQVIQAVYNGSGHGDIVTKVVDRHIPRKALQRWEAHPTKLIVDTDQFFGSGFESR